MSGKARTPAISSGTAHALKAKALNFGPQLPVVAQTKVRGLLAFTTIFWIYVYCRHCTLNEASHWKAKRLIGIPVISAENELDTQ